MMNKESGKKVVIVGTGDIIGKTAHQFIKDGKGVIIARDSAGLGKTCFTEDQYLDKKTRNTFDRSRRHLGDAPAESCNLTYDSLAESVSVLSSYQLTDTYEKLDDWDHDEGIKWGPMGGETESSRQQFENRIKRNRKRNKNKKTHRRKK